MEKLRYLGRISRMGEGRFIISVPTEHNEQAEKMTGKDLRIILEEIAI